MQWIVGVQRGSSRAPDWLNCLAMALQVETQLGGT